MKSFILRTSLLTVLFAAIISSKSYCQISVPSSNGYNVNIVVLPVNILPTSPTCPWGYNYNLRVNYNVSITGTFSPGNLYTLQGNIGCAGGAQHFFSLPLNGGTGVLTTGSNQWTGNTDCATSTVTSMLCNTAQITIQGLGIPTSSVNFPITYVALPVQLTAFSATAQGDKVKVKWSTATETNSAYFAVERSADSRQWYEMTRINGAGNSTSTKDYEWTDQTVPAGISFYRLKQIDNDNHINFSEVKSVYIAKTGDGISVYPVPNPGNTITISGLTDYNNQRLTLINGAGAIVYASALSSFSVSLPELKPGLYIIRLQNELSGESRLLRYTKL